MKVLNREIEFDFLDVESFTKYENAINNYMQRLNEIKGKKVSESEGRKILCEIVYNFFDELLGQGTAKQLLGDKYHYGKCVKAMQEIIEEKLKSDQEINDTLGKYSLGVLNELVNS